MEFPAYVVKEILTFGTIWTPLKTLGSLSHL